MIRIASEMSGLAAWGGATSSLPCQRRRVLALRAGLPDSTINGLELWIVPGTVPRLGAWAFTRSWAPTKIDVSSCHPIILKSCAKRWVPLSRVTRQPRRQHDRIADAVYAGRACVLPRALDAVRAGRLIWKIGVTGPFNPAPPRQPLVPGIWNLVPDQRGGLFT